jgi:adenylate cyclase
VRSLLRVKQLHDEVHEQAALLAEQSRQLADLNRTLEQRVASQVSEIERIRRLERFLAPQLVQMIASSDSPELTLASHRREITVVFCDLRGFTAFTDTSEPEEVMAVVREYHGSLGELIFEHEGTLDRFIGDGIMIVFNDPIPCDDHSARAVRLSIAMRARVAEVSKKWVSRGHDLGFGVGIASGYATLGQVGFEKRREYTAIGRVTNLAARLCGEAAAGQIIISQSVFNAIQQNVAASPPRELNVKGFSRPVPAYEVLGWHDDGVERAATTGSSSEP